MICSGTHQMNLNEKYAEKGLKRRSIKKEKQSQSECCVYFKSVFAYIWLKFFLSCCLFNSFFVYNVCKNSKKVHVRLL